MTTINRIARTLDAIWPFKARLRRPAIPCTVLSCNETDVLIEIELITGPWQGSVPPSAITGLPPEPPRRTPESVRVRELLAEAPRTVVELEAVLRAEGLDWWAVAGAVAGLARSDEIETVGTERYRPDGGRWRSVRRWGLVKP